MTRPPTPPHAEVLFELTSLTFSGEKRRVLSGYRPVIDIKSDYWTSVHMEFPEVDHVTTGEKVTAEVWFLTPEVYPHTLWVGRTLHVAEGSRQVGEATVLNVFNSLLLKNVD